MGALIGQSDDPNAAGVLGESATSGGGTGVYGRDRTAQGNGVKGNGVIGYSENGRGIWGHSKTGYGVLGESVYGRGVVGTSQNDYGIRGHSNGGMAGIRGSSETGRGVEGESTNSDGVVGNSLGAGAGVIGVSDSGIGVHGKSVTGPGVEGESTQVEGVVGTSHSKTGVWGRTDSADPNSAGVFGFSKNGVGIWGQGGRLAGFFDGSIEVTGNIDVIGQGSDIRLTNADCAEDFDVSDLNKAEPGTVMVLGNEGALRESQQAYDKRVAGVISGAGDYKPAIVLDSRRTSGNRQPIALMGKVFCKVDAQFGAIEVGDLLTTSPTPGHAMAVSEPVRAFGTIIGKALRPLTSGKGLIPILVALQ